MGEFFVAQASQSSPRQSAQMAKINLRGLSLDADLGEAARLRPYCTNKFQSLHTNGDGACSIHALVGTPTFNAALGAAELFAVGARSWISETMTSVGDFNSIQEFCRAHKMTGILTHICELIGSEMIWAHLRGTISGESAREAQIFMQYLKMNDPKLLEDIAERLEVEKAFLQPLGSH